MRGEAGCETSYGGDRAAVERHSGTTSSAPMRASAAAWRAGNAWCGTPRRNLLHRLRRRPCRRPHPYLFDLQSRSPDLYLDRNIYRSFIHDPLGEALRHFSGGKNIMWSSDYLHSETVFPHSLDVIEQILPVCRRLSELGSSPDALNSSSASIEFTPSRSLIASLVSGFGAPPLSRTLVHTRSGFVSFTATRAATLFVPVRGTPWRAPLLGQRMPCRELPFP